MIIKMPAKFSASADFTQEKENFSAILSLIGENILYKTKEITDTITNNFRKSIVPEMNKAKSMRENNDLISIKELPF
jgi:hypothetical protein